MSAAEHWSGRSVVVTGGASFVGSHLVDRLVRLGARVTVVDDLSSGRIGNIAGHVRTGAIALRQDDLRRSGVADASFTGADTVFHLAAAHGGRGYIATHQSACAENLLLDAQVFGAAVRRGVRKIVFASSACVYPVTLQSDPHRPVPLRETMAGPPYEPDDMYGWAKLTGELTLAAMHAEHGLAAVSCRYFGVYGPRATETHALIAMMARALIRQSPLKIWGDGTQLRSWCFVTEVVRATLRAAERIDDASAVNIGSTEAVSVRDAASMVMQIAGHESAVEFEPGQPTGPVSRCGDFSRARELLGWQAKIPLERGLRRTFRWYRLARETRAPEIEQQLETLLLERRA